MKELFVSYELSLALKEKGFDEPLLGRNSLFVIEENKHWFVPELPILYQQVIDWFREKHDIHIKIEMFEDNSFDFVLVYDNAPEEPIETKGFTYYEALNKAIEEALKLIPCPTSPNAPMTPAP